MKNSNHAMAEKTLTKITDDLMLIFEGGKLVEFGYDSLRDIPSKKEMENLTLFFDELREKAK